MRHYIGLDVSMKRTFICVINEQGKMIHEGSESTDPHLITDYLAKLGLEEIVVGFESGSLTPYLLTGFKERAIEAICMDARKLSPILELKINKTDKNDARGIAEALRSGMYTRVHCKPEESIDRAILLTSRRALVEQQTHLKNTVRGLLKGYGIRLGAISAKKFSSAVMKRIEGYKEIVVLSLKCLLDAFDKLVEEAMKIDQKMLEIAYHDKEVQRFMTIPGIGPVTALTYKAEIFDATRFKESRSVGAYLGMTPTQYASGETQRQGKTSKCGSKELRFLLVESGIVILTRSKKWSKLKAWGLKIMRKKGLKKAAVAVGRKLAIIMHRMMLEGKDFIYGEPKAS
jgi:transposase